MFDTKPGIVKFGHIKKSRTSKLMLIRPGFAETIYYCCFSEASKEKYNELVFNEKKTRVGIADNPLLGKALFADEDIEDGEMICLYHGIRMSAQEGKARIRGGCDDSYMINLTRGVYVDGSKARVGACMANHSCNPNSELQHDYLPGPDRAPIVLLRAVKKIQKGEPINCWYRYFDLEDDALPDILHVESYEPCHCGAPNCCGIFYIKD